MEVLKFKTNINCLGCIAKATDTLNNLAGIEKWSVDTSTPDKILSIANEDVKEDEVINAVEGIGFKILKIVNA